MSFGLLYPKLNWKYDLQSTGVFADISGVSSIVVGSSDEVYFAFSAKGVVGSLAAVSNYQIVIGCLNSAGVLQWLFRDPQLVSTTTDSEPSLAIGSAGELYVVFRTVGAVPGKANAFAIPSFCPCGTNQGPEDLVVARINGVSVGSPAVAWVVQDLSINSCSRETKPRILYDAYSTRVLIAYQSTGAIICGISVGSPNIIVTALNPMNGGLLWVCQSNEMNSPGQNRTPSIAVDPAGSVYVAYTITAKVLGGAVPPAGSEFVEVIKFTPSVSGCVTSLSRNWILSAVSAVNPSVSAISQTPYIVFDPNRNRLYLTFTTNGVVPGGSLVSGTTSSIVFASIHPTSGSLLWLQQSGIYNEFSYKYTSISNPVLTLDVNGGVYAAARAIQNGTGQGMIYMYRINPETGASAWIYMDGLITYRAYLPAINSMTTPNTAYRVGANYSEPWLAIRSGSLYVAFANQDTNTFHVVSLGQIQRYQDSTAFEYMNNYTGICS